MFTSINKRSRMKVNPLRKTDNWNSDSETGKGGKKKNHNNSSSIQDRWGQRSGNWRKFNRTTDSEEAKRIREEEHQRISTSPNHLLRFEIQL